MTNIRRYPNPGNVYFTTHVTLNRMPILVENIDLWLGAVERTNRRHPFEIIAWAVLPDHCHLLVDPMRNDLSRLMRRLKLSFAATYRDRRGTTHGRVWQYRFWDHIIRNERDYRHHIDYIHYNPVKHGMASCPQEWQWSSVSEYISQGLYPSNWDVDSADFDREYGE